MWNSFYVGGPNRSQRMEAFKQILAESAVPVEIVILQEMFTFGLGPLCDKSEGWLEVEVQLPSMKLVIITTHLEHAHTTYWRRVRASQWLELAERIKAIKEDNVILLGDFNALDDGQEFDALLTVMDDVGLSRRTPTGPTLRTPEVSLVSSPDHIFVSSKLKDRALNVAAFARVTSVNARPPVIHLSRDQVAQDLEWLTLPENDRPDRGVYPYWRISSIPPQRSVNVYSFFWEYAKAGIISQRPYNGFPSDTFCMSLIVVDLSVGTTLPCADWSSEPLLPSCSLQVKVSQLGPGSLVNMPFLKVGDIVRGHRMMAKRKQPRYLNLWWKKHTSVAIADSDKQDDNGVLIPPTVQDLQCVNPEHLPTTDAHTNATLAELWNFIRSRLSKETISRYLKTVNQLTFAETEDLVVQVLAINRETKVFLATDWSSPAVEVRAATPALHSQWLFQRLRTDLWLKIRWVRNRPPEVSQEEQAMQNQENEDEGANDLYALASQITPLPSWCQDVRIRVANRTPDLEARVHQQVVQFERQPPARPAARPAAGEPAAGEVPAAPSAPPVRERRYADWMEEVRDQRRIINFSFRWSEDLKAATADLQSYRITNVRGEELPEVDGVRGELIPVPIQADFPLCVSVLAEAPEAAREAEASAEVDPSTVRRAAKLSSVFGTGDEEELQPIRAALTPEAPGNLLLGKFRLEGISGSQLDSSFTRSPAAEDLITVTCRTCGLRFPVEEGRRIETGEPPRSRRRLMEVQHEVATIPFSPEWPSQVNRWREDGAIFRTH
eukprot:symbB.v1.2.002604.t2/scaffold135.1/size305288/24